jgi:putative FmdB family regulatory protein
MPTYDYECPDCGHRFEAFQAMTAKPIRKCPSCGKRRVRRLIGSGLAPIFKGSGFYQTDYKAKPVDSSADKPAESRPQGSGPEEGAAKPKDSTENKPAEKPTKEPDKKPATKSQK